MEICLALGCVVIAALVLVGHYVAKREDKDIGARWAAMARERGWTHAADDASALEAHRDLRALAEADDERASSALRWREGDVEVCIVDHYCTYGARKTPSYNTIVIFRVAGLNAPRFYTVKRGLDQAIHKAMAKNAIDLGEEDAFAKRFAVHGDDADAVRARVSPALRHALAEPRDRPLVLEVSGDCVAVHRDERVLPEEIDALLEEGRALLPHLRT